MGWGESGKTYWLSHDHFRSFCPWTAGRWRYLGGNYVLIPETTYPRKNYIIYREQEDEAIRCGEDADRPRKDRNEWREYEVTAWGEEGSEHAEATHESKSEGSVVSESLPEPTQSKISRKEADKVLVPTEVA